MWLTTWGSDAASGPYNYGLEVYSYNGTSLNADAQINTSGTGSTSGSQATQGPGLTVTSFTNPQLFSVVSYGKPGNASGNMEVTLNNHTTGTTNTFNSSYPYLPNTTVLVRLGGGAYRGGFATGDAILTGPVALWNRPLLASEITLEVAQFRALAASLGVTV
jgi:hypothetical protein